MSVNFATGYLQINQLHKNMPSAITIAYRPKASTRTNFVYTPTKQLGVYS